MHRQTRWIRTAQVFIAVFACSAGCGTSQDVSGASTEEATGSTSVATGRSTDGADSTLGTGDPGTTGEVGSDEASSDSSSDGGTEPIWPRACADFYAQDLLPTFELSFTPDELAGLQADCEEGVRNYRPVELTYDGETVAAMARLKGNWSWDCDKMQFVISFNEIDSGGRFHGVRKLVFDAPWYDHTLLHERIAFSVFEDRDLPYSCVNNARVVINGEYYGLFANVERLDKEYLQRHFLHADGNLYEGGVELKTNERIGDTTDIEAVNAARTVEELEALMDLDQAVAEWATEAMLPAMDNYWAGVEINYYLYNHPLRGFVYLPFDMDITFGDGAYPGGELIWPDAVFSDPLTYEHPGWEKEALMMMVLSDQTWCERFVQELEMSRAMYSPDELGARVDSASAQIAQALADDPNKPFSVAEHEAAVASMRAFFTARAQVVDEWLAAGNHCPAVFP